jgi:hypothetical protein
MILPLRQRVSEMMVRVHLIPPDLAAQHVREMPQAEVWERYRMYVKFGLARRRWDLLDGNRLGAGGLRQGSDSTFAAVHRGDGVRPTEFIGGLK